MQAAGSRHKRHQLSGSSPGLSLTQLAGHCGTVKSCIRDTISHMQWINPALKTLFVHHSQDLVLPGFLCCGSQCPALSQSGIQSTACRVDLILISATYRASSKRACRHSSMLSTMQSCKKRPNASAQQTSTPAGGAFHLMSAASWHVG